MSVFFFINAKIMQNQMVKLVVVISVGYISIRNSYQKYCEVNEIKTGKFLSYL